MNFVLKPSLEHMALVQIGISLWNQNDVRALIIELNFGDLYSRIQWKTIQERVIKKARHLLLPQLLKEKVLGVINPIGSEILEWMEKNHNFFNVNVPFELCWTPQGTVDQKRTAEVLIEDGNLNVSKRYRLACTYCLENDIKNFWSSVPEDLKDYHSYECLVINFWSYNMKREGPVHISYKDVFYSSATSCNKAAAKYFLQKLTPQEREECFEKVTKNIDYAHVLCFLLPEMDAEEQKKVLKNNPTVMLKCFLQWPWQSFFIGVANCMWDFLSKINYHEILGDIIYKVKDGYKDYNYQKLFREFWQKSPSDLKDSIIEDIDKGLLLRNLCDIKDKEIIKLILKDATLMDKEKLIYSDNIAFFCQEFISDGEWNNLEFFIQECLQSKNEMLKFKDEFEKRVYFKECSPFKKHRWNQLFYFSDDSIYKYGKRSVEETESSSSKRFQSLQ